MAGLLTRLQMANEALDNCAKSSSLTLQSGTTLATRMAIFINRAQFLIARREDFLQAIASTSTVASQQSYSFPSRLRSVFSLRVGLNSTDFNGRKLTAVMPWEMDTKIPYPATIATQIPTFYVPYENTLTFELISIPDQAYAMTLRYSYFPTYLSTDAAFSDYTDLDDALVAYATMYGFRWLQEVKDATYWENIGNTIVADHRKLIEDMNPDWAPFSEGFSVKGGMGYTGEYWNNPLVNNSNSITGWR